MRRFTVTIERRDSDRYGDPASDQTSHRVPGCIEWPTMSTEQRGALTQVTTGRTLIAPHGADVVAEDVVVYPNGTRWHVVGDPFDWSNPHAKHTPGVQIALERVR